MTEGNLTSGFHLYKYKTFIQLVRTGPKNSYNKTIISVIRVVLCVCMCVYVCGAIK